MLKKRKARRAKLNYTSQNVELLGVRRSSEAFLMGCGTAEQIFTHAELLRGSWEFDCPVHMCFVDLEETVLPEAFCGRCCRIMGCWGHLRAIQLLYNHHQSQTLAVVLLLCLQCSCIRFQGAVMDRTLCGFADDVLLSVPSVCNEGSVVTISFVLVTLLRIIQDASVIFPVCLVKMKLFWHVTYSSCKL